ncbi:MAG: hypothetical protein PHW82_09895 [Bacteroidales bacterium]|nr:hypothetical protein [Bacteroidales bacterium]
MRKLFFILILFFYVFAGHSQDFKVTDVFYHDSYRWQNKELKKQKQKIEQNLYDEAMLYLQRSEPDLAIETLFDLLKIVDKDSKYINRINISIAEGYREKREYQKGLDLLYATIIKNDLNKNDETYAFTRIAAIYNDWQNIDIEKYDSVIKYSNLSIANSIKHGYPHYLATSQNELGFIYIQKNEIQIAIEYLTESLKNFLAIEKHANAIDASINLSNAYLYAFNYKMAEKVIDTALTYCSLEENENLHMRLYLQKAKVNEYKQDYKLAYEYLSKGRLLQRKFFNDRLDSQIFEMSAKYDLKLKEVYLAKEKHKVSLHKRNNIILAIVIIVLIFVLLAAFIIYRLNRKYLIQKHDVERMQSEILKKNFENKNIELSGAIAAAVTYNKVLESIKKAISSKDFNEAVTILNANINTEQNWQRFLLIFNELDPDFFVRLKQIHPSLTTNEIKLSALLKMGYKSSEIAGILNIATSSVDKKRQRLRKKIHLDSMVDLSDYFKKI